MAKIGEWLTDAATFLLMAFYALVGKVLSWVFGTDIFGGKK